jgi:hypothetical protein
VLFVIFLLLALLVVVVWWALATTPGAKRRSEREPFTRSDVDVLVPRYVRREHERHVTWVEGCPLCEHARRVEYERREAP